jgi:FemAB-related protein (PEP-CTERM system-associated)
VITPLTAEDDGAEWNAFVAGALESTFCHLAGWREIMTEVMGHECLFAYSSDPSGAMCGVLPLVRVKSALFGHYLVSMPFLNAGGPLGTPDARQELGVWALAEAERSGADLLELRAQSAVPGSLHQSNRKITVQMDLPAAAEAQWRAFPSKLRSQIRRSQKEGLETRFGLDQRESFYDVFARTMRALGTPVLPPAFFARIARVFPELVEFGVVYKGDRAIAAGCGFTWNGLFEITWAGSLREHARVAPNMLLYWAFIERAIGGGVRVFDFGRCTPGGGTHQFKRQWGGSDVPLPWAQWSPRAVASTPSPDRPIFRLATACWRRLPLAVANGLGPLIARRLP